MDWAELQEADPPRLEGHPRYEELGFLGRGAYGTVVKARDKCTGAIVALKFIRRQGDLRFASSEVLSMMRLHHPHITELKEVFLTEGHLVLVLEYAAGGTLADLVSQGRGLPPEQARWVFTQLLCALDYCHAMGIASRDVKLQNILLDRCTGQGTHSFPLVKLADFGHAADCVTQPLHSNVCGTPAYFSPELVLAGTAGQPYDAKKADVWSCGVLLYILLTGTSPFQQLQDSKLGREARLAVLLERIVMLEYRLPSWLPSEARDIIRSMLEPDPSRRPSVSELLDHPWCLNRVSPGQLRAYNANLLTRELANPPSLQLVCDVQSILQEAAVPPAMPNRYPQLATPRAAEARPVGDSTNSSVDGKLFNP